VADRRVLYAEACDILNISAKKLQALARGSKPSAIPTARFTGLVNGKPMTTKVLTPVPKDAIKEANEQAADILGEAKTRLLRSAESSDRRLIYYAQFSPGFGSNKVLRRSLWLSTVF
jgi:hypothetical protein